MGPACSCADENITFAEGYFYKRTYVYTYFTSFLSCILQFSAKVLIYRGGRQKKMELCKILYFPLNNVVCAVFLTCEFSCYLTCSLFRFFFVVSLQYLTKSSSIKVQLNRFSLLITLAKLNLRDRFFVKIESKLVYESNFIIQIKNYPTFLIS